jgi:type IV secretion system protein VirD4
MKRDSPKQTLILCLFGLIPVVWGALLVAPSISGGIPGITQGLPVAIENPFHIEWCEDSLRAILIFIAAYIMESDIPLHPAEKKKNGGKKKKKKKKKKIKNRKKKKKN